MERPRQALWQYVDEVSHLVRKQNPTLFTPWGARLPYAWSGLSLSLRQQSQHFQPAINAALSITKDDYLRSVYGQVDPDGVPS